MKITIDKEVHEIVYIEYNGSIPHSVVTRLYVPKAAKVAYWRNTFWDVFANNGDKTDLYAYESGSGGRIQAPQWIDGHIGEFWMANGVSFEGEPKNFKRLSKPKRIRNWKGSSINPLKIIELTHSHEYCEECGESSTEVCTKHVYEDENDHYELKYKHNNEPYN